MIPIILKESGENNTPAYEPEFVQPFREDLTTVGFKELFTPADVDKALNRHDDKIVLLMLNSVCGCAAGSARPGTVISMLNKFVPDEFVTLFAGMEKEAVSYFREKYLPGLPPTSPNIVFFKNGQLLLILRRHNIEGKTAIEIAKELMEDYNTICHKKQLSEETTDLKNYIEKRYQIKIDSLNL